MLRCLGCGRPFRNPAELVDHLVLDHRVARLAGPETAQPQVPCAGCGTRAGAREPGATLAIRKMRMCLACFEELVESKRERAGR